MNVLSNPRLFDVAIIALFFCAAIRWACAGNWPKAVYWCAAGVLNIAVTYM